MEDLFALFGEDEEVGVAVHLNGGAVPYRGGVQEREMTDPAWGGRALMQGEEPVAGLYARVNAGRLRQEGQERGLFVVQSEDGADGQKSGAVADVRELDRVFRRDARRYDGGLGLL